MIQPDCKLVDLYMAVDGTPFQDTKFCCGEGGLSPAALHCSSFTSSH